MGVRTYEVVVEREGRWWVFEIPELGIGGQARSLAEVDDEAQGVVAMWLDADPATIAVHVTVKAAEHALAEWRAAGRDEEEARKAQAGAAARRREATRCDPCAAIGRDVWKFSSAIFPKRLFSPMRSALS